MEWNVEIRNAFKILQRNFESTKTLLNRPKFQKNAQNDLP